MGKRSNFIRHGRVRDIECNFDFLCYGNCTHTLTLTHTLASARLFRPNFFLKICAMAFDFTIAFDLVNVVFLLEANPPLHIIPEKIRISSIVHSYPPEQNETEKKKENRQSTASPFCRWHNPFYTFLNRSMYTMSTGVLP